jgi:excisionase family DNA binding protein
MNQQFFMLSEEGIKALTEQISENILKVINPTNATYEDTFMTIEETSKMVNLCKATIYGLTHQNDIPFHKKGKRLYFLKSEILTWIKSGKRESKSDVEKRANEYLSKNRLF